VQKKWYRKGFCLGRMDWEVENWGVRGIGLGRRDLARKRLVDAVK
jgi:hypothetical protein